MSRILLLCTLFHIFWALAFDYTQVDYCKLNCGAFPNVGCHCQRNTSRREILDDVANFRKQVVDAHNGLRNRVARGDLANLSWPQSANMQALIYDLELEHLARCSSTIFSGDKDRCRKATFCKNFHPSQLFCTKDQMQGPKTTFIEGCLEGWTKQAITRPRHSTRPYIDKYSRVEALSEFTLLVWAKMRKVGCSRIWDPDNPKVFLHYVMICNYAAEEGVCAGNILKVPMYVKGKPCSQCGQLGCNKDKPNGKYEALCGDVTEVPKDELTMLPMIGKSGITSGVTSKDRVWKLFFSGAVPVVLYSLLT